MRHFVADLHIHTALSPCASDEMTPPDIVRAALSKGVDVIAICDHNSAHNAAAVQEAGGRDLSVIAGIEITTSEEIHVIGLFPDAARAQALAGSIASTLPIADEKATTHFGEQRLLNARGQIQGYFPRLLAGASGFNLSETVELIRGQDGLAIAAHIDRRAFSVLGQLGAFPSGVVFDAIEVSAAGVRLGRHMDSMRFGITVVTSSDSHFLEEVGCCSTMLEAAEPSFEELAWSIKGVNRRRCFLA